MEELHEVLSRTAELFQKIEMTGESEVAITTGCVYDDQTDIILYISKRDDTLILTDNGRTRAYMDKVFELTESDVIVHILAVTKYYGISTGNKQLSIDIGSMDGFVECYLRMIYCICFLDTMKVFYV